MDRCSILIQVSVLLFISARFVDLHVETYDIRHRHTTSPATDVRVSPKSDSLEYTCPIGLYERWLDKMTLLSQRR